MAACGASAAGRVSNGPNSLVELKKQLEVRTRELAEARGHLSEALEQQAATSEVLSVISSSPGELEPVFQAMLANAMRICEAKFGMLFRYEQGKLRVAATHDLPTPLAEWLLSQGEWFPPFPGTMIEEMVRSKQIVYVEDVTAAGRFQSPSAKLGGARTIIDVPMLKHDELIGAITIYRQEVRPFTDKQVALLTNFAAQAVIAIENTRLLNELRQRTGDLSEALEQQTATSEVLQIISSSPGVMEPVFQAMLENATRICGAKFGTLYLYDGDAFHATAFHNAPPAFIEARRHAPLRPRPDTTLGRAAATKQVVHIVMSQSGKPTFSGILLWSPAQSLVAFGQSFRCQCSRRINWSV